MDPIAVGRRQWDTMFELGDVMEAAMGLRRARQLTVAAADDALATIGLSGVRHEALVLLTFSRNKALSLTKLSQLLMIHPTSVTSLIDRLERDGLVERVADGHDRRSTLARITPSGVRLAKQGARLLSGIRFGLVGLDSGDLKELRRIVAKLRVAVGDEVESESQAAGPS